MGLPSPGALPLPAQILALQRAAGNRAVGSMLHRAPAKPPRYGPAAAIPDDRGDVERGYFSTTDKVTYGVRASGPGKPEGLWVDHLFDSRAEAEEYAQALAAKGALAIRQQSALPYAWPAKTPGGLPVSGNPVTHVYVVEVPAGTGYIQGVVREQPENRRAPWVPKSWEGGGAQTVISWNVKTKAVAEFPVAKLPPADPGPIPPPPDWLTAKKPVAPTAPPAVVSTDDPRTVGRVYSPNLIQQYRTQQLLYKYSSAALSDLEDREQTAKGLGVDLSEDEKKQKAALAAQVTAAQAAMLQARKDYEMLDNPATTPQQLQEMFARRGIAVPVVPQTHQTGAAALEGSGISGWGLDEKGLTKKSGTATTRTVIGPDGRPVVITDEDTRSTNVGLGTAKQVTGTKVTVVQGDTSTLVDKSKTTSVDLIKGEGSVTKDTTTTATDASGTTTKTSDKTTYTAGLGGFTRTKEDSTQVGSKIDSTTSTRGITRGPGQLGMTAADTKKSGTMIGPPGQERMGKGTEQSSKLSSVLVSDDKGTGIGGTASQARKTMLGEGKTVGTTVAAGGRCQALVAEIPGSDPPRFTITTTISFDFKLGATAGKEWQAKPGAQQDTGLKGNVSVGGGAAIGAYAAFKRELTEAEAKEYIDYVKANGRGSKLPEHKILATGASRGWERARELWLAMNGSPDMLKSMKPASRSRRTSSSAATPSSVPAAASPPRAVSLPAAR